MPPLSLALYGQQSGSTAMAAAFDNMRALRIGFQEATLASTLYNLGT